MTKCFTCLLTLIAVLFANVDLTANSLEILENVFDNLINSKTLSSLTPKSMTWDPNICSHKFLCIFQMSNLYFQTDAPRCQNHNQNKISKCIIHPLNSYPHHTICLFSVCISCFNYWLPFIRNHEPVVFNLSFFLHIF